MEADDVGSRAEVDGCVGLELCRQARGLEACAGAAIPHDDLGVREAALIELFAQQRDPLRLPGGLVVPANVGDVHTVHPLRAVHPLCDVRRRLGPVEAADPVGVAGARVGPVVEPRWERPRQPVDSDVRVALDGLGHHEPLVAGVEIEHPLARLVRALRARRRVALALHSAAGAGWASASGGWGLGDGGTHADLELDDRQRGAVVGEEEEVQQVRARRLRVVGQQPRPRPRAGTTSSA